MHKRALGLSIGRHGILAALAIGLLAGCGEDDEQSVANPPPASSAAATLEWQAPTTASDGSPIAPLTGYRIYYGTDVMQLDQTIEVLNSGVLTYVVEGLSAGTYYFAVTALNANGESPRSNAGRKTID